MVKKKVFVTGASGYLGKELVKQLSYKGYSILALVRNEAKANEIKDMKNVKLVIGDVTKSSDYANSLYGIEGIFHLAAVIGSNDKDLNFKTNVDGTNALIKAAKENKIKRFIFTSTIAASYQNKNYYAESKLQAEKLLYASGLDVTVIRPNLLLGKASPQLKKIEGMAKLPVIPVVGSGKKLIQPVNITQVADVLIQSYENENTISHTISVSGSEAITFNQFLDYITNASIGKVKPKFHIPIFACNILAGVLEKVLKDKAPLNKGQVTLINQDSVSSFKYVKQLFNLKEIKSEILVKDSL